MPDSSYPLNTERLALYRPRLADAPALFRFLGDREAMRHTQVDATLRACRRRIAAHEHARRRDGCAPWTVVEKASGEIVGWGGLYHDPFDRRWGIEVGYAFHPKVWGKGYATELVTAGLRQADRVLALPEVWAFAQPDNLGSRRVLDKTGFTEVRFVPEMARILHRRMRPS